MPTDPIGASGLVGLRGLASGVGLARHTQLLGLRLTEDQCITVFSNSKILLFLFLYGDGELSYLSSAALKTSMYPC